MIDNNVYDPSDDSYLLAENLKVKPEDLVLEIGTGSGLIALVAARVARKVIATDISPIAIKCAKNNLKMNSLLGTVEVREGYLFDPIHEGEKFDLIIFNPPYLPKDSEEDKKSSDWHEKAWDGGKFGRELIDPFIAICKSFLNPKGRIQMVQSSLSDISKSCDLFKKQGFQVGIGEQKSFFFEKIVLINAWLD